jgi:Protein of unknown function (DUF3108)
MHRYLLLSVFLVTQAWAASPDTASPSKVKASYFVYKGSMSIAQIDELYVRDGDRYKITSTVKPLGLLAFFKPGKVHIQSQGTINAEGLQPMQFSDLRDADAAKNSHADFSWSQSKIILVNATQKRELELELGTQDRLSAMYQFMFLSLVPNSDLDFSMTNGNKLDDYHYRVSNGPKVFTNAGKFSTLYLDSQAKKGESRTQIWLANEQHLLPCKVIVTDGDGDQLKQVLQSLTITP